MPGYHNWFHEVVNAWLSGKTIKCALLTSSYTPNLDHDNFDDITNEVSGTGYTAGGATMANVASTDDDTNDRSKLDADDVTWSTSTITARYAVIYYDTGTDSTSRLIAYIDFGEDKSSVGADFTIQFHANGICYFNNA